MSDIIESSVERLVERAGTSYFGKYRGIVTNVDDPLNQCRVRARVDGLLHGQETGWALPVAPFAGDGHGMVMLPAVGAGVWIEFEAGRLDNPIRAPYTSRCRRELIPSGPDHSRFVP